MENSIEGPGKYDLAKVFDALSHPVRIEIVALLSEKRRYVSDLARALAISRLLLYMHLQKLEAAHLVDEDRRRARGERPDQRLRRQEAVPLLHGHDLDKDLADRDNRTRHAVLPFLHVFCF